MSIKRIFLPMLLLHLFIVVIVASVCVASNQVQHEVSKSPKGSKYEIPLIKEHRKQQVIEHVAYTVSYNSEWLIPNWVAYELNREETYGDVPREKKFSPDPFVKGYQVQHTDYSNSGYDRGHMAPAGDMKWSTQAMRESFYTSNICPQNRNNNAGDWKDLEELARSWAYKYGSVFICCGPIVTNVTTTIGPRNIVVPEAFYKVFLRKKHNGTWASIGFIMPNVAGNRPLMTYMQSVDDVEKVTGIDFFYNLPDSIEDIIEADYNLGDWVVSR